MGDYTAFSFLLLQKATGGKSILIVYCKCAMKLGYRLGWFTSFFCNININIERERETETETETETERQRVWSNGWWFSLFMHLLKKFIRVGLIDLFSSWYLRNNDFARLSPDLRVIWKFLIQNKTLENLWVGFILYLTWKCFTRFW